MDAAAADSTFEYDHVPYPGAADAESHLRYVEAIASVKGIEAADLSSCRVLEIGCASGMNLLPLAEEFPGSDFIGIDLAAEQIKAAATIADQLQMRNVEFRHGSLSDVDQSWGPFDYILCLGVLSWVPPEQQDAIFEILRTSLTPDGVAVVSYKTLPGWHHLNAVRDALRSGTEATAEPAAKIKQARELLELLANEIPADSPHAPFYRSEREWLLQSGDDYLFHDYLSSRNYPVYFQDFYHRAVAADVQYVCDASITRDLPPTRASRLHEHLDGLPVVERCQMLDFVSNAAYRKSLLCRKSVSLAARPDPSQLKTMCVSLREVPRPSSFELANTQPVVFEYQSGSVTITAPFGKAALKYLIDVHPKAISLSDLCQGTNRLLPAAERQAETEGDAGEKLLAGAMLGAVYAGLVQVCRHAPQFVDTISERPKASALARLVGRQHSVVVNRLHQNVRLSNDTREVLTSLDGTRDVDQLGECLRRGGAGTGDDAVLRVDAALQDLCNRVFLID